MITSTCGRFDNAPAHIIINSVRFATRELKPDYESNRKSHKKIKKEIKVQKKEKPSKEDRCKARDQMKATRIKERRHAAQAIMIAALPSGYEIVRDMDIPVKFDVAYKYIRRGMVPAKKIGLVWYARRADIIAEYEASAARQLSACRENMKQGRMILKSTSPAR